MDKFVLLKRTYPTSLYKRICDGYIYIIDNSTKKERKKMNIIDDELQKFIEEDEKYVYEVGKDNGKFTTRSISYRNLKIIRKHFFGLRDE